MIDARCPVCKKPDVRRLVVMGWNTRMSAHQIVTAMSAQFTVSQVMRHLREHEDEGAGVRAIPVEDARPLEERVMAIQRLQLDEMERRITMAQEWAEKAHGLGNDEADWSDKFDILNPKMQAAVTSIIKAQNLTDTRKAKTADLKVDVYRLMLGGNGGLAPQRLIGGGEDENTVEGEARDVTPA